MNSKNEISDKSNNQSIEPTTDRQHYLFSPLILMAIMLLTYPYWIVFENLVNIKNQPNSFLYNNLVYISTGTVMPFVYLFYKRIVKINNIILLDRWEEKNPEYERAYWMDPLELNKHYSLMYKYITLVLLSATISLIIIYSSVSIVLFVVYLTFESDLILLIFLITPFVYIALLAQVYSAYLKIISARGWYLHDGYLVSRTALIFRSLPDSKIKPEKLVEIYIEEKNSYKYTIPIYHLMSSRSKWTKKIIASSFNFHEVNDFKNVIQNYFLSYQSI